jgi:hypothetical protein
MAEAAPRRTAGDLLKELLLTGALTVVTTRDGSAPREGAPLDAVTVIQLDGDVINYLREGAPLERHFAALRRVRGVLRLTHACFRGVERGVFWTLVLGGQYYAHGWLLGALAAGSPSVGALLGEARHVLSSLAGIALPFALHRVKLILRSLLLRHLQRSAAESPSDVLSGRKPRPV